MKCTPEMHSRRRCKSPFEMVNCWCVCTYAHPAPAACSQGQGCTGPRRRVLDIMFFYGRRWKTRFSAPTTNLAENRDLFTLFTLKRRALLSFPSLPGGQSAEERSSNEWRSRLRCEIHVNEVNKVNEVNEVNKGERGNNLTVSSIHGFRQAKRGQAPLLLCVMKPEAAAATQM
eukprot:7378187-Prymnesium_polylepis.2